ncbi:Gfo/Idh/MocA family oxidoreductase [Candidatus Bathyarchaeota archaeon]|nr:Gfo/Idh/MocA family oxidoreductase [Candidatus Bathyarchaeota archaeon]
MKPINVAILSFAHFHAYSYARALKELPNVRLLAVFDDDKERGVQAARRYGADFYEDYRILLKREDVEAVLIASENVKHAEMTIAAAEAGKHVLVEKPMATSLKDADAMIRAARKAGLKLMVCYVMRYSRPAMIVKELLDRGTIGRLRAIVGTNRLRHFQGDWFVKPELSGGGAIMDHTVHLADLMRWYTGSEVDTVYTEVGTNIDRSLRVEDCFLTLLDFRNGVIASIDGSWSRPESFYTWGDVTLEVLGTDGTIILDAFRQVAYLCLAGEPKNPYQWHHWGCDVDKEMVKDFISCIREDREPRATGFDGRQGTEITLASYESAKTGMPVRLPLT